MGRAIAIAAVLAAGLAAGCSGGDEEAAPRQEKAAAPAALPLGQWEVTSEVTRFAQQDKGSPKIATPVGTKASGGACVSDAKRPDPTLFVGKGYDCTYRDSYITSGTLNANLECKRAGLSGQIMFAVSGSYTADTLEAEVGTTTYLSSDGDVTVGTKLTGRRTGDCAAP